MNDKQLLNQAFDAHKQGNIVLAEELYSRLITSSNPHESVFNNLAAIYIDKKLFDRAIQLLLSYPNHERSALISSSLAATYKYKADLEKAVVFAQRSLTLDPEQPDTWNNLGSSLRGLGQWDEAILALNEAAVRRPKFSLALYNLGNAYLEKRDLTNAIHYYNRAIDADEKYANAYVNRGNCYRELRHYTEAEADYIQAYQLDPSLIETQFNLGVIYMEENRFTDAISCFSKTLTTEQHGTQSLPHLIGATQKICDWKYHNVLKNMATSAILEERFTQCPAFNLISILDDPELIYRANIQYTSSYVNPPKPDQGKLRFKRLPLKLTYFSNDIHDHATGYLIAELFELHDKELFDVTLISYGPDVKTSRIRDRIKRSGVRFVEASMWSDPKIVEFIKQSETDILVDLKGYTAGCRPQVLAAKPAPIQIQYLGYPATMGAQFIDYFIGDHIASPASLDPYFSEKIVRLSSCYQINDTKRHISEETLTRADCGLPEDNVIFASFNSSYKITPELWAVWMSILKAVDNSILWLLADNEWAKLNLINEAEAQGIDRSRLIFGEKLSNADHLNRLKLADLALDTYPCCGHTTTSDALFAGLPVLTLRGNSFHSRVSASLLSAQGLDFLITDSLGGYATTAIALTASQATLHQIKNETIKAKKTGALFNTPAWVNEYENALINVLNIELNHSAI